MTIDGVLPVGVGDVQRVRERAIRGLVLVEDCAAVDGDARVSRHDAGGDEA